MPRCLTPLNSLAGTKPWVKKLADTCWHKTVGQKTPTCYITSSSRASLSHLLRPRDSKAAMRERVQQPRLRYTPALSLRTGQEGVTKLLLDRRMNKKQCSRILVRRIYRLCHHTPEEEDRELAAEPTLIKHLTQEDLEGIDSAVDFLEDIDEDALESIMNPRAVSRMSFSSDGSSVLTERADSRASVCTPPPTIPCCRFTSSLAPATFAVLDVPFPTRTRAGEASELRLRRMLSEREKYTLDPCSWKLGAVQVIAHRSGMVKFINDLRRDFGLNSGVTWRAVTLMDRYVCLVSSSETSGCHTQRAELCAVVCLLLACKFQEMHFPSIPQLLECISSPYTKQELKAAELEVLGVLGWSLNSPSPHAALEEMVNVLAEHHGEDLMPVVKHARIVIELALWDPQVMTIHPMVVAAAALLVAWSLQLYGKDPLPGKISASVLCDLCDVPADELARCEGILADLAVRAVGAQEKSC